MLWHHHRASLLSLSHRGPFGPGAAHRGADGVCKGHCASVGGCGSATSDGAGHSAGHSRVPRRPPRTAVGIALFSLGPDFSSVLDKYSKDWRVWMLIAWLR